MVKQSSGSRLVSENQIQKKTGKFELESGKNKKYNRASSSLSGKSQDAKHVFIFILPNLFIKITNMNKTKTKSFLTQSQLFFILYYKRACAHIG